MMYFNMLSKGKVGSGVRRISTKAVAPRVSDVHRYHKRIKYARANFGTNLVIEPFEIMVANRSGQLVAIPTPASLADAVNISAVSFLPHKTTHNQQYVHKHLRKTALFCGTASPDQQLPPVLAMCQDAPFQLRPPKEKEKVEMGLHHAVTVTEELPLDAVTPALLCLFNKPCEGTDPGNTALEQLMPIEVTYHDTSLDQIPSIPTLLVNYLSEAILAPRRACLGYLAWCLLRVQKATFCPKLFWDCREARLSLAAVDQSAAEYFRTAQRSVLWTMKRALEYIMHHCDHEQLELVLDLVHDLECELGSSVNVVFAGDEQNSEDDYMDDMRKLNVDVDVRWTVA